MVRISFSERTISHLSGRGIHTHPHKQHGSNVEVDLELTRNELGFMHTIILYDLDAPYPDDNYNSPYLHWIVANIRGNDIDTGRTVFGYVALNPPSDSPNHRYVLEVLRQRYPLEFNFTEYSRIKFPLEDFIEDNNLEELSFVQMELGARPAFGVAPLKSQKGRNRQELLERRYTDISEDSNDSDEDSDEETLDILNGRRYTQTNTSSGSSRAKAQTSTKRRSSVRTPPHRAEVILPTPQQKFCDCVIEVGEKGSGTVYNAFAVCAKSTGTTSRSCGKYYDFEKMNDQELKSYLDAHKVSLKGKYNRKKALDAIKKKLSSD